MYEDSWYSFVPSLGDRKGGAKAGAAAGHKRKESLLQQSNVRGSQEDALSHGHSI